MLALNDINPESVVLHAIDSLLDREDPGTASFAHSTSTLLTSRTDCTGYGLSELLLGCLAALRTASRF